MLKQIIHTMTPSAPSALVLMIIQVLKKKKKNVLSYGIFSFNVSYTFLITAVYLRDPCHQFSYQLSLLLVSVAVMNMVSQDKNTFF